MRGTKVDLEKKTVTAQGGCLWADVDSAASEHGMATPGGTVNHTGIGGLTLGGGYGYLTGLHGMVVDNLVSARVVLASGEIATASQTTNPDLFWALRGAGHNFGVVTSFEYALYPQGDVWCGVMAFTPDKLEPLVNFLNAHNDKHDPLAPCFMFITCPPHITSPMFAAMVFYNGTEEKGKEVYKPLLDLGPVFSTMSLTSYASANGSHNDQMVHGPRRRVRGGSFHMPLSIPFVQHCLAKFQEMVEELPSAGPSILAWEFFDNKKVNEVPIDATAFCNRGDHHNMTIGLTWTGQENDEKVKAWARYFGGEFEKALKTSEGPGESKGHATPIYVNNIECEFHFHLPFSVGGGRWWYWCGSETDGSDVVAGDMKVKDVFGVNYPKLQKLKGKYDPGLVFDKTHPIQPVFE
jgi:FAD binding domain/Berberine and berberine like